MSGSISFHKGKAAEDSVVAAYQNSGFDILDRRWRRREGELDIVAGHGDKLYFVEVKASSSHDRAAENLTMGQQKRIHNAALRYLAEKAKRLDVECRFDAATVDAQGRVRVIPGAFDAQ